MASQAVWTGAVCAATVFAAKQYLENSQRDAEACKVLKVVQASQGNLQLWAHRGCKRKLSAEQVRVSLSFSLLTGLLFLPGYRCHAAFLIRGL